MRGELPVVAQARAAMERLNGSCGRYTRDVGFTYVIRQVGQSVVKIGKAIDPPARLADIQRMNGGELELVSLSHYNRLEGELHREHAVVRRHGEWFALDVDPAPLVEGECLGCRRFADRRASMAVKWRGDLDALVVPEVPVIVRPAGFGRRQGLWHPSDNLSATYDMHGGGSDAAITIAEATDRRRAIIGLALMSAYRTGANAIGVYDEVMGIALEAAKGIWASSWCFWPEIERAEYSERWDDAIRVVRKSVAALDGLTISAELIQDRRVA
jgi:hypothetical protein